MRIFVVDDDPIYRLIAKSLFESVPGTHEVTFFNNGADVLNYFKEEGNVNMPEIIMLDIEMPELNGWEFLEAYLQIPEKGGKSSVYIVTSSIKKDDKEKAAAYSCVVDYIAKPLTVSKIYSILTRCKIATGNRIP